MWLILRIKVGSGNLGTWQVYLSMSESVCYLCHNTCILYILRFLHIAQVNINVKIILEEFKGNNVVRDRRRYLPKTVYTVADTTGYISLTVWCEKKVTVGEWYKITNVSVIQFNGKTTLSTTKPTDILNIPSQGTAVDVEVPIESMTCEIIGVSLKILFICAGKHELKDLILSSPSVYCASCRTHYKTKASIMKISGRLDLKPESGNILKARVEDEVIRSVVAVKSDASENDIIQALMSLPPMQTTICNNVIVKMEESTSRTLGPGMESQTSLSGMEPVEDSFDFSPPDLGLFNSQSQKRKSIDWHFLREYNSKVIIYIK